MVPLICTAGQPAANQDRRTLGHSGYLFQFQASFTASLGRCDIKSFEREGIFQRRLVMHRLSSSALASLCVLLASFTQAQDTFNWNQITPTENLLWTPCNGHFECARLNVPLDYKNPNASSAAIALLRLPAGVPNNSSDYRGPILFNPGGPGASGVNFVLGIAEDIRAVVGPQFDLVGFDPRGIARSVPTASFFGTNAERVQFPYPGSLNASQDAFGRAYAAALLESKLAAARDDGSLRFINTESTARDMLTIVQAHGREKLQYAGFSYGTILGATFAAMFPDKIERMLLDGVGDPDDYYSTSWLSNLIDTHKTWAAFLQGCVSADNAAHKAYPRRPGSFRVSAVLWTRGLLAFARDASRPALQPVRRGGFGVGGFQELAAALHSLSLGNATALYQLSIGGAGAPSPFFQCPTNASADVFQFLGESDGQVAVSCNDGKSINVDYADVENHFREMCEVSPFCDIYGIDRMVCLGWPEYLKNNFTVSFKTNTSFPILLISNTADPVTPLASAQKMSAGFDGSVLLTQDSPGHTSLVAPSLCTFSHIAAYFVNGTLPAKGTVCSVDAELFPDPSNSTSNSTTSIGRRLANLESEEREMLNVLLRLTQTASRMFGRRFSTGIGSTPQ
ncbi:Abhydrolase-4 domain-containing protein [Mycena sanguinolenta]|uniref:Abhydrolase-4 domain-containing protein n=1 Tax=Mycena sanguinolenta TaxID=230812 RepID=A0A8H6XAR9_9AGAR|nr:Abhydrolase-4 domain-containing protein [Mycena sanguinolenta]